VHQYRHGDTAEQPGEQGGSEIDRDHRSSLLVGYWYERVRVVVALGPLHSNNMEEASARSSDRRSLPMAAAEATTARRDHL
jgi:truncated hemoglobin YjbI